MEAFITAITDAFTGIFTAILKTFGSIGELIFVISEQGAITGVAPFGYVLALIVGVPLATWAISKGLGFIRNIKIGSVK